MAQDSISGGGEDGYCVRRFRPGGGWERAAERKLKISVARGLEVSSLRAASGKSGDREAAGSGMRVELKKV